MNIMNKNIISILCKSVGLALLAMLLTTGCQNKQDLFFGDAGNKRSLDLIEECEKILLSNPNGWQMTYEVPDKKIASKFTLQLQFKENKSVVMWSDFLEKPTESSYRFSLYNGPVLTFDTPGALTELADPAIKPFYSDKKGNGYWGENDFTIYSVSKEKIVLKGLKYGKVVELIPLKEPANLTDKGITDALYTLADQLTKFGSAVQLQNDAEKLNKIAFDIPKLQYYIPTASELPQFKMILKPMKEGDEAKEYSITYTSEGLKVAPALEVAGQSYTEFIYDEAGKRFTAKDNEKVFINLQALSPLTVALTETGGKYCIPRSLFYPIGMSDDAKKYLSNEECEKIFKGFAELQLYNQPGLKSFTFFHKPDGNNGKWQNILFKGIKVIDDEKGIYQFVASGFEGDELKAALDVNGINPVKVLAIYFTSLGKDNVGNVQIKEVKDGVIRVTSIASGLWIDFKFATW